MEKNIYNYTEFKNIKDNNEVKENINVLTNYIYPYNNTIMTIPQIRVRLNNSDIQEKKYFISLFMEDLNLDKSTIEKYDNKKISFIIDNISNPMISKRLSKLI
jgi:hypothetical protein